jgi:hypothetical protein
VEDGGRYVLSCEKCHNVELNGNPDRQSVVPNGRAQETKLVISRDILRIKKGVFDSYNDAGSILSVDEIPIS